VVHRPVAVLASGPETLNAPLPAATTTASANGSTDDRPANDAYSHWLQRLSRGHEPWSGATVEEGATCRAALLRAGVTFRNLPDRATPDPSGCGIPHPVVVTRGPTGIRYGGPLFVDCSFALELPRIEAIVQEEAMRTFQAPVTNIATLGSYSCRKKRGKNEVSEHAVGNAIDLAAFGVRKRGTAASVARHYGLRKGDELTLEALFLERVEERLRDDTNLSRVLGPRWDAAHRDHFHLDRGRPGWWKAALPVR
jgi:hypothetical protein